MSQIIKNHPASVNDFRVIIYDDQETYLKSLTKLRNKRIVVRLELESKHRSMPQNRYYWSVPVKILSDHWGYTKEEVHEILKWQFLKIHGEKDKPDRIKSTTELDTKEWEEYMERIRIWASIEFECYIPEPNEIYEGEPIW